MCFRKILWFFPTITTLVSGSLLFSLVQGACAESANDLNGNHTHSSYANKLKDTFLQLSGPIAESQLSVGLNRGGKALNSDAWKRRSDFCIKNQAYLAAACFLLMADKGYFQLHEQERIISDLKTIDSLGDQMPPQDHVYLSNALTCFVDRMKFVPNDPIYDRVFSQVQKLLVKFTSSTSGLGPKLELRRLEAMCRLAQYEKRLDDVTKLKSEYQTLKLSLEASNSPEIAKNREAEIDALNNKAYEKAEGFAKENLKLVEAQFGKQSIRQVPDRCVLIEAMEGMNQKDLISEQVEALDEIANTYIPVSYSGSGSDKEVPLGPKSIYGTARQCQDPELADKLFFISFELRLKAANIFFSGPQLASSLSLFTEPLLKQGQKEEVIALQRATADYLDLCDFQLMDISNTANTLRVAAKRIETGDDSIKAVN